MHVHINSTVTAKQKIWERSREILENAYTAKQYYYLVTY